jgi:hypothetical protein
VTEEVTSSSIYAALYMCATYVIDGSELQSVMHKRCSLISLRVRTVRAERDVTKVTLLHLSSHGGTRHPRLSPQPNKQTVGAVERILEQ